MKFLERAVEADSRVELVLEDLPTDVHLQMFADADVCMAPARWEGLGLHLYEAIAFGQPIVCNDDAPMNELVVDGVNGMLVPSHDDGLANSGIPARTVDVDALTDAISRLADPDLRAELSAGALRTRDERSWDRTVADFASLLTKPEGGNASGTGLRPCLWMARSDPRPPSRLAPRRLGTSQGGRALLPGPSPKRPKAWSRE